VEIDSRKFIKILNKNFKYPIVKTKIGNGVQVDCRTAFLYSLVSGAGYLDNHLYPFTVKGLMKVFYTAMDYKFVTGLFDNTTLRNTPYILSKAKPYLFNGMKVIVPVEFNTEIELQNKLRDFVKSENHPTDFLIQRIECSKQGNGMEPFMEYLACEVMKRQGYIVENQIPLTHSTGSPDFGGYLLAQNVPSILHSIHLIELSLLRLGFQIGNSNQDLKMSTIVGEAKTGSSNMTKQLEKYLDTSLFDKGYEIHPSKQNAGKKYFGLVTLDDNFKIVVKEPVQEYRSSGRCSKQDYIDWLSNYMKFYLVANLSNDEFSEYFFEQKRKKISNREDIVNFVIGLTINEILLKIKSCQLGD